MKLPNLDAYVHPSSIQYDSSYHKIEPAKKLDLDIKEPPTEDERCQTREAVKISSGINEIIR